MNERTRLVLGALSLTALATLGCSADVTDPNGDQGTGGSSAGSAAGGAGPIGGAGSSGTNASGAAGTASGGVPMGGAAPGGSGGAAGSGVSGSPGAGAGAGGMGAASGAAGAAGSGAVGGSGGSGGSMGCGKMGKTGAFQQTMTADGLERGYYLSVPLTYDSSVPNRLVFGYHGSNYTGERMRQYLELERAPLVEGTVFVYPDGLPLPGSDPPHLAWVLTDGSRDMVFFDELLARLTSEYCIDPERIFVNGQSYGGLMTNAVGCFRGDVIRAIAVVAGSGPRGGTCRGQVAAWLTHGTDDDSVDFMSGVASRDHWIEANHCTMTTLPGMPEQCQDYQGCDAGYPVIWCPHTGDGGHQHPSFGRAAVREFLASF